MRPYCENTRLCLKLSIATLLGVFATTIAIAQDKDLLIGVTYVCNGERMFIENCNIRDTSDNTNCMVGHPDHVMANGLMQYTNMTRGALKKLFPTCTQPSAKELAAAATFKRQQQEIYDANVAKANPQMNNQSNAARPQAQGAGMTQQPTPPKNAEERAMRRCVSSGRLPATCMGNGLLGGFSQMIAQVLPGADKAPAPGPNMAGVFQGAGNWRLDFIDGGVLVNCSFLSPNQQGYTLDFKSGRTVIVIDTTPKPLVLTLSANGTTIVGPGPVTIDGVVASGTSSSGPDPNASSGYTDKYGMSLSNQQAASSSEVYSGGQRHYGSVNTGTTSYTNFAHR